MDVINEYDAESEGAERIWNERIRQIGEEGYDLSHDEQHTDGFLAEAALAYAFAGLGKPQAGSMFWPWNPDSFKPSKDNIRNFEKAGALFAAAIDRALARHRESENENKKEVDKILKHIFEGEK